MLRITVETEGGAGSAQIVESSATVDSVLEEFASPRGVDINRGDWYIGSRKLSTFERGQTFESLGFTDGSYYLINVLNKNNA